MADYLYDVTQIYKQRLIRRQKRVLAGMVRDWRIIIRDLENRASLVGEVIRVAAEDGGLIPQSLEDAALRLPLKDDEFTRAWLFQQKRYTELIAQAEAQLERLAEKYGPFLEGEARAAAFDGAQLAARQLRVSTAFATQLSAAAVEAIAAETALGPVSRLLRSVDVENRLRDAMLKGIARGANPRAVAREVAGAINATKQQTLTIARTEMARAQRQATYDSYRQAGVAQWQWLSAQDASTCAACWSMDGETFDVYEEVDDHPNGRCAIVPVSDGIPLADLPSRDQAWNALSESDKLKVLGPTRYDLVSSKELDLADLGGFTTSEEWGTSIRVTPLAR